MAIENSAVTSSDEGSSAPERGKRPMRAVGLISTLSVALGVGSALASMPFAGADTTGSAGASDATSQAPATRDTRGPARADRADQPRAESPARRNRVRPSTQSDATTAPIAAGKDRASAVLDDLSASSPPAADRVSAIRSAGSTGVQITEIASTAAAAPLLKAASPRGSLSAPGNVLMSLLNGGGNPAAPDTAPLAWAAVALTRRATTANAVAAVASTTAAATSADPAVISLVDEYKSVLEGQVRSFISSAAVADVVAPLVANGAADWILNGTVGPELTQLASDATVGAFIAEQTALQLNNFGVPPQISSAVGSAVARAVRVAFGDATNTALIGAVDTFIGAVPWVSTPLVDTLTSLVSGEVTVVDIVGSQLGSTAVTNAATALLENAAVPQAIGTAVTTVIRDLAADSAIRALISDQLGALIGATAADGPTTAAIGAAINDAVTGLLADSAFLDRLAITAGTTITTFLSQPGIPATLTGAAGQIVAALISGTNADAVLQASFAGLRNSAQIQAAISTTLGVAVAELLADPAVPGALGTATTAVIRALAADPTLGAALAEQLAALLTSTADLGPAGTALGDLGALLADPAVLTSLATIAGSAVTSFLSQPGLPAGLSAIAQQVATALQTGTDPAAVLAALQTNPQLVAAIDATLPGFVNAVLGIDQLRQALSAATGALITAALADPALTDSGLGSLSVVAGTVTDAVVDSLLGNPAVGTLISTVAADVLSGTPSTEALNVVVDAVLTEGALQIAVGTAIGQGVGSLFGENIIGGIIGWVAGGLASLTLGIAAGIANLILLFNPGFTLFPAAAAASSRTDSSYVLIVGATA